MYSNWLIYSGKKGTKITHSCARDMPKNNGREVTEYEKQRITEVRDWSFDFFRANSLRSITWTSDLREPADENAAIKDKYSCPKVDLVLKTTSVSPKEKLVNFIDHHGKKYSLFLQAAPVLKKDEVIKLRCVDVIFSDDGRLLSLTDNSSCLIVPDYFFDAQLFNRSANVTPTKSTYSQARTQGLSGKNTPITNKRAAAGLYPFLGDYNYEEHLINPTGAGSKKKSKQQSQQGTRSISAFLT